MSIEAMKQAIEALERAAELLTRVGLCFKGIDKAITSLRQAIAEAEKQEPVMGVEVKRIASGGFIGNVWWIHENLQEGVFHLYTHPPVPQGHEPKQEPLTNEQDEFEKVFQLPANCTRFKGGYAPTSYNAWDAQTFCSRWEGWKARAAHPYTRQPKRHEWVGLTDEQFQTIRNSLFRQEGWDGYGWDLGLKEAIEAKLKEKNT